MATKTEQVVTATYDSIIDKLEIIKTKTKSDDWHNNEVKNHVVMGMDLCIGKIKRMKDGKSNTAKSSNTHKSVS